MTDRGGNLVTKQSTSITDHRPPTTLPPLLDSLRPKQWTKNLLLFAGFLFTINEGRTLADFGRAVAAFALFCLISGSTYLINDLRDREADRLHPKKKNRPIASGRLSAMTAIAFAAIVIPLVLGIGWWFLGLPFGVCLLAYLIVTLTYSFALKHIVLVDVFALSTLFLLRAVAGSVAIRVQPSQWLLLCTFLLALFLALAKRRAELVALGGNTPTRPILAEYSLVYLDQMITLVATTCIVSYLLYTFLSPTGVKHPWLMATAPFVLYGLFRYLYLSHRQGQGEAPETILLSDRPMQINLLLWLASVIAAMLLGGPSPGQ